MASQSEHGDTFQTAFQELVDRAARELDYIPEEYLRTIRELGALPAAKVLLAQGPSNDSLELWVRGNRDLTIEALARSDRWRHLFSDQERMTADGRYADWSFEMAELGTLAGICPESEVGELFLSEDDLVWGEELSEGIDICQKLAQVNTSVEQGNGLTAGWTLAYYRKHLADCPICADNCGYLKQSLEDFDRNTLSSLHDLLMQCIQALKIDRQRAKDLLSREWNADHSTTEGQRLLHWARMLELRAGLVCASAGAQMVAYEETHDSQGHPWTEWRTSKDDIAIVRFVRELSDKEFLTALLSRNVCLIDAAPRSPTRLVLPTDGDLIAIPGTLAIEQKTKVREWEEILSQNFITRTLMLRNFCEDTGTSEAEEVTSRSDRDGLNWGQIISLSRAAAVRESSLAKAADEIPLSKTLSDLLDTIGSLRGGQTAIFDLLDRIAGKSRNERRRAAGNESLKIALGDRIHRLLSADALTSAISAEQLLHDQDLANPGLGIMALCIAWETELKAGLLAKFCTFLRHRNIRNFPDSGGGDKRDRRHQILIDGHQAHRLTLGDIKIAFDSTQPEILEFCKAENIDFSALRREIEVIQNHRNSFAHGKTIPFVTAHRIREQILGVVSGDGGAFKLLFPKCS